MEAAGTVAARNFTGLLWPVGARQRVSMPAWCCSHSRSSPGPRSFSHSWRHGGIVNYMLYRIVRCQNRTQHTSPHPTPSRLMHAVCSASQSELHVCCYLSGLNPLSSVVVLSVSCNQNIQHLVTSIPQHQHLPISQSQSLCICSPRDSVYHPSILDPCIRTRDIHPTCTWRLVAAQPASPQPEKPHASLV